MRYVIVLCHYCGVFRNEEEDPVYIGGEKRILVLDADIPFHLFERQIRHAVVLGPFR